MGSAAPFLIDRQSIESGNVNILDPACDGIKTRRHDDQIRFVDGPIRSDDPIRDHMCYRCAVHVHQGDGRFPVKGYGDFSGARISAFRLSVMRS